MYHVHCPEDKILYTVTEVSQLIHTAFAALYFMGAYRRPRPGWGENPGNCAGAPPERFPRQAPPHADE